MWNNLPSDLLSTIFSYLSPESLARAKLACHRWNTCTVASPTQRRHHLAWFFTMPTRGRGKFFYTHNPVDNNWHTLLVDFIPTPFRPVASINGLILIRLTSKTSLQLAICNPFTRQFKHLPMLNITRTNPAIGIVECENSSKFGYKVYVAGGMAESPGGGASYEPRVEMYDAFSNDKFKIVGSMPMESAVRLTVWTPNEGVYCNGVLYWITSARAYSVIGFEIGTNKWRESSVPLADRLEFAALVPRNGKLTLIGGASNLDACVWELGEGGDAWSMIEKVPFELGLRFLGGKASWGNTKCVGIDGAVCLYRDLVSGIIVWRKDLGKGEWKWCWIDGYCSIKGKRMQNFWVKGLLLHPNLASLENSMA